MKPLIALLLLLAAPSMATAQGEAVTISVQGETNLKTSFLDSLRAAGLSVRVVPRAEAQYQLLVAQETTFGSAAAAVVALDPSGEIVASVVRSGRFSGQGALNACAKELAKRLKAFSSTR